MAPAVGIKSGTVRDVQRGTSPACCKMHWLKVDLILGPTSPTTAFKIGEHSQNALAMYLADIYTASANLAGVPAISIPCGISDDGLPIGFQLQARSFDESTLLQAAHQFQTVTDWHQRRPQS